MKILAVDDSRAARQFAKSAVDLLGFDFVEAENGERGLAVLEELGGRVDLILLDWIMPVMNGLEMLKAVKADERFRHIPVTVVTTEVERQKVIEAISAGAKNYLMKPYTQDELVGKIIEALGIAGDAPGRGARA